jgi:hypothetical protein
LTCPAQALRCPGFPSEAPSEELQVLEWTFPAMWFEESRSRLPEWRSIPPVRLNLRNRTGPSQAPYWPQAGYWSPISTKKSGRCFRQRRNDRKPSSRCQPGTYCHSPRQPSYQFPGLHCWSPQSSFDRKDWFRSLRMIRSPCHSPGLARPHACAADPCSRKACRRFHSCCPAGYRCRLRGTRSGIQ